MVRPARRTESLLWLQSSRLRAVLTFATPTALLLGVMLAPSVLALALDRAPGRPVARAVAMAGLAFALSPLWRLCWAVIPWMLRGICCCGFWPICGRRGGPY